MQARHRIGPEGLIGKVSFDVPPKLSACQGAWSFSMSAPAAAHPGDPTPRNFDEVSIDAHEPLAQPAAQCRRYLKRMVTGSFSTVTSIVRYTFTFAEEAARPYSKLSTG